MSLNFSLYFILYKLLESRNRLLLFLLFSHCLYLRYTMWRFGTCINDEVIITVKLIGTPTTPMRALRLWPRGADRSHGLRVTSPGLSILRDRWPAPTPPRAPEPPASNLPTLHFCELDGFRFHTQVTAASTRRSVSGWFRWAPRPLGPEW